MQTLNNTAYKLITDKKLNVVYFGGSVTHGQGASNASLKTGTSWAAKVNQYLVNKYPEAKINGYNAAIGGTGSYLGLFRSERDVLPYCPDLVFIEFAVNDRYQGYTKEQAMYSTEAIIRKINSKFPTADIVMLFTTDWFVFGTQYEALLAHKAVAEHYGIPHIDLGAALYTELNGYRGESAEDEKWREYLTDIVHPADKGYKVYADAVIPWLDSLLPQNPREAMAHVLPQPLSMAADNDTTTLYAEDIKANDDWEVSEPIDGTKSVMRCQNALLPSASGATLTLKFSGNTFGMGVVCKENANVTVTVDGTTAKIAEKSAYNEVERFVFSGLSDSEHTATIHYGGPGTFAIGAIFIG